MWKKFLPPLLIALIASAGVAQTPTQLPVTGNVSAITGGAVPYAAALVELQNCASPVSIAGYSVIVQQQYQIQANGSGVINSTVWPNDQIDCNGTTGNSQYMLTYIVNGVPTQTPQCYQVVSTQGAWNLNTQQPINCSSSPPSPTDGQFTNLNILNCLSLNGGPCVTNAGGTLPVANGGTGATTAAGANLNITGVTQTGTLGTSSQVSAFPGSVTSGFAPPLIPPSTSVGYFWGSNVNTITPQMYGAKGDGITDDTSAMQAAISNLPARASLSIPDGTYNITSPLTMSSSTQNSIIGLGRATLVFSGTGNFFTVTGAGNFYMSNIRFLGPGNNSGDGLVFNNCNGPVQVDRILVNNFQGNQLNLNNVYYFQDTGGSVYDGNSLGVSGSAGIYMHGGSNVAIFQGAQAKGNVYGFHGANSASQIYIIGGEYSGTTAAIYGESMSDFTISDILVENAAKGILLGSGTFQSAANGVVQGNGINIGGVNGAIGIECNSCARMAIASNGFFGDDPTHTSTGIQIDNVSGVSDVNVSTESGHAFNNITTPIYDPGSLLLSTPTSPQQFKQLGIGTAPTSSIPLNVSEAGSEVLVKGGTWTNTIPATGGETFTNTSGESYTLGTGNSGLYIYGTDTGQVYFGSAGVTTYPVSGSAFTIANDTNSSELELSAAGTTANVDIAATQTVALGKGLVQLRGAYNRTAVILDGTATTGATSLLVGGNANGTTSATSTTVQIEAGASQSSTPLLSLQNNSGSVLSKIDPYGAYIQGVTKFTATGCTSITTTVGNGTAGKFIIGANSCTVVITMNGATGMTAASGWSCTANDETTAAGNTGLYFSTNNTTTATLAVPSGAAANDIIDFACHSF